MNNSIPIKAVYLALFNLLKSTPLPSGIGGQQVVGSNPVKYTWQRTTRRTIDWDQVAAADMPLMLLHGGPIEAEQRSVFQLPTFTMRAYCWVFMRFDPTPDDSTTADDFVQDVFDAINSTLQGPVAGERQTLAGTIYHAFTEGCMFEAAIEDNQILMFVPIIMRTGV